MEDINEDLNENYQYRIQKLHENDHLLDLHKELVQKGVLTEDEFWEFAKDIKEYDRKTQETQQKVGVPNRSTSIAPQHNNSINAFEINLNRNDAQRLLR